MSLRLRLVASIVLALLLSFCLSGALAVSRASDSVRTELGAAMAVGRQVLRNGVADLSASRDQPDGMLRLLATFDGNRHLRAVLLSGSGAIIAQSLPMLSDPPVPRWFVWLVAPRLQTFRTAVPGAYGGGAILLRPEPANEVGEVWASLGDTALELATFCAVTSALIFWVAGRALRPLEQVSDAFGRIGAGDYGARVANGGPPELVRLADGFNRMAGQLAGMTAQNQRLHEQLLTLQDEERADLARDLHDEIGPFLFSVNVTAASINRLVADDRAGEIPAQLAAIREAVGHMQKHVRAILARLRPVRAIEFGLEPAVAELVEFWGARYPAVAFDVAIDPGVAILSETVQEVIYRVVQESLSNAVRHGRPNRIDLAIAAAGEQITIRITDDGSANETASAIGFGLSGMRERVASLGGTLHAGRRRGSPGWQVTALLPVTAVAGEPLLTAA